MGRHPLVSFFVMAFAFSWIVWIPYVLSIWHALPVNSFSVLSFPIGTFLGPALAAFLMTGISEGDAGLGRLLHRFAFWRTAWPWYLFILLGIPAMSLLGILALPGALASYVPPKPIFLVLYLEQFFVVFFLGGPLAEETGWRGFALPGCSGVMVHCGEPCCWLCFGQAGIFRISLLRPSMAVRGRALQRSSRTSPSSAWFASRWPSFSPGSSTTTEAACSSLCCCMPVWTQICFQTFFLLPS